MNPTHLELLETAREADVARGLRHRRQAAAAATCRRLVLGIIPVHRPCASDR